MTEAKCGVNNENAARWAGLKTAGLFREGVHTDTKVIAITPSGQNIELSVVPVPVNGKRDTFFVPPPSEAANMAKIFPRLFPNRI